MAAAPPSAERLAAAMRQNGRESMGRKPAAMQKPFHPLVRRSSQSMGVDKMIIWVLTGSLSTRRYCSFVLTPRRSRLQ
eukprot:COSAG02_NODE_1005_length_15270_cov_11.414607_2_plen_78_part_00